MLGLSLAIRVGKRVLGGLIDSLMSAIKGRATYSENIADSKQVLKDIDNYELLDKASILLTPTAYSDARVHSVKTYTGEELVTNGTYDTDLSGWTNTSTHWQWSSGSAYHPLTTSFLPLKQTITNNVGAVLRITFDLTYVQGTAQCFYKNEANSDVATTFTSSGSYTIITEPVKANTEINFGRAFGHNTEFYIDNVSVLDVSSDFDFDRASSATRINSDGLVQDMQSITDPELVLNGDFEELGDDAVTNGTFDADSGWFKSSQSTISNGAARILSTDGSYQYISQTKIEYTNTQSKYVKITLDIVNYVSGTLKAQFSGGTSYPFPTSVGTHTIYVLNDGSSGTFNLARVAGVTDITIDNVSVQQVDPNDRWSLSGAATFEDGVLHFESATNEYSYARQDISSLAANTYEIQLEIKNYVSGACQVGFTGTSPNLENLNVTADGTYTAYISPNANGNDLEISREFSGGNFNFDVEVVSVKDITFSTDVDLARINYDSNGENGHWLLEPTSTNLITYSEDFSEWELAAVTVEGGYLAPDGSNNAYKVSGTVGSSSIYYQGVNATDTRTIWAKTVSGTGQAHLCSYFGNTNNLKTITNEWQRFEVNGTTTATGATNFYAIDFRGSTDLSEIIIWGAQSEALSYATSYIPTYGSTVTRATETLTGSGNSTLINSTEGVLYAEIAALADDGTKRRITLNNGTSTNFVQIEFRTVANQIQITLYNGAFQGLFTETITDVKQFNKIAYSYKENEFKLFVNGLQLGSTITTGTTFSANTLDNVSFDNGAGSDDFYGKCKALAVFDEALEDDELELLTGITNYGSFNELAQANGYTII